MTADKLRSPPTSSTIAPGLDDIAVAATKLGLHSERSDLTYKYGGDYGQEEEVRTLPYLVIKRSDEETKRYLPPDCHTLNLVHAMYT